MQVRNGSSSGIERLAAVALMFAAVFVMSADPGMANSPFGVGLAEPSPTASGPFASFFAWIAAEQSAFYRSLQEAIKQMKADGTAGWWLVGLSFAYGVFHAAGPGHGKAVISSYVLANEETLRRGIVLSFAAAMAQAVTAIVLIGVAALILNMTSIAITETTRWFELGSYLGVMMIGAWLLWTKAARPFIQGATPRALGAGVAVEANALSAHHNHDHQHHEHCTHGSGAHVHRHDHSHGHDDVCPSCGHAHAPDPSLLQGSMSIGKAWSVVLAVGLRPCTGALVVLVFAMAQGLAWAGVLSTLAMAVGTGITVSLLASLAVGAKGLALRYVGHGGTFTRIHRAIEIFGALLVFMLGATLFIAAAGWSGA